MTELFLRLRNRHIFALDVVVLLVTPTLALMLRLDTINVPREFMAGLLAYTLVALIVRLGVFFPMGLYRRFWAYASIDELVQIALAVLVSTSILALLALATLAIVDVSFARSLLFLDALLVLLFVGGSRFGVRFSRFHRRKPAHGSQRLLIVGAGDAGTMIVREMQSKPRLGLDPVAFLDDDPRKHKVQIYGLPVLGGRDQLVPVVNSHNIERVIIAMPTAPGDVIREIATTCDLIQVKTETVPALAEILDGQVGVSQLRKVAIEDLLRRDPVRTDVVAVRSSLRGRRVLVTGGGGSIGRELCRQILHSHPAALIILGHGENSVFEAYHQLKLLGVSGCQLIPVIADIRFQERIQGLLAELRPEVIFHAAAHKHVPLMERNPAEAISNNVLGTQYLLDAALASDVERFVMISTDKAVNPSSIMGASKRVAEILVHRAAAVSGRPYVAVRFGNVLGSRGSVVFTFQQQIAAGGPVTVTDPGMKRYFMTIPEAVQLVLQASLLGQGGEMFVLDMGEPVRIEDLARDLIQLSGLELGRDIAIEYVGRRPGDKLFEELYLRGEHYQPTEHEKIFVVDNAGDFVPAGLDRTIESLRLAAHGNDRDIIIAGLRGLVPEFEPAESAEIGVESEAKPAGAVAAVPFSSQSAGGIA